MRWLFLLGVWVLAEGVGYWGLRQLGLWRRWIGWITPLTLGLFLLLWAITAFLAKGVAAKLLLSEMGGFLFSLWLMLILVKLVVGGWGALVGVVSRLHRRLKGASPLPAAESAPAVETLLSRRQFLVGVGEALALAPVGVMGYAFLKGRYRFQVEEVELRFPHLPIAFDGLKLLQISDLHSGSFYFRPERLEPAWELIQKARADVLCFTGDWVNVYAEELEPFVGVLSELSAPLGKWATLGNHDYGDYARWNSPTEKTQNHHHLLHLIEQAGFTLLQDTATCFRMGEEALYLVGTGNWGYWNRRQRYGDIGKAWRDVPENAFTILLTHDPTHWEYQVSGKYPAALTLSGHTHGLQMGIPVNGRYWSPASWLYRYWAGLYEGPLGQADGHTFPTYLYVNRGLGYIGLPARFGVWPEITLIRLRRG
jgi:predicted MPP superfamily phosphohydrolase